MKKEESFIDILLQIPIDICNRYTESKLPLFIKKIFVKRYIKNTQKVIDRLLNDNVIIDKDTLDQYLSIIYNQYQPDPSYGCISYMRINTISTNRNKPYSYILAELDLKSFKAKIKTHNDDKTFDIELAVIIPVVNREPKTIFYTFTDSKMITKKEEYSNYISKINHSLIEDMVNYFTEYINSTVYDSITKEKK